MQGVPRTELLNASWLQGMDIGVIFQPPCIFVKAGSISITPSGYPPRGLPTRGPHNYEPSSHFPRWITMLFGDAIGVSEGFSLPSYFPCSTIIILALHGRLLSNGRDSDLWIKVGNGDEEAPIRIHDKGNRPYWWSWIWYHTQVLLIGRAIQREGGRNAIRGRLGNIMIEEKVQREVTWNAGLFLQS